MKRIVETVVVVVLLAGIAVQDRAGHGCDASVAQATPRKERAVDDAVKAAALPAGVRAEEVEFDGAGLKLAGTLLLPSAGAGGRAPAVLIIGATPFSPRDGVEVIGGKVHYTYRDLAVHLAARGYAVLRYDPRCVGASGCQPRSQLFSYVEDGRYALDYLRTRPEIDPQRIVVFGHGDGAFLASTVAAEGQPAGLVLAAASGRTGDKLLRDRAARYLAERGVPEAERLAYLTRLEELVQRFKRGSIDFSAEKVDPRDEFLSHVVKYSDFMYSWLQDDPLQGVSALSLPVLILQGEKDTQMGAKDAHYLEDSLKRAENTDVTLRLLADADHALKINKGAASFKTDTDTSRPLDAEFLKTLDEWLDKKLKK